MEPLRRACDYVKIRGLLPSVLDELHYHAAGPADEPSHRLALEALVEACVCATFTAKNLNYLDLAHLAARRAWEAASVLDDPIHLGKASYVWLHTLPRAGSLDRNMVAAERAANRLEPYTHDPLGLQVLGMITLTAAPAAASLQKGDAASHWLGEAEGIASRVADEPTKNWQSFSPTNVDIWRGEASLRP